MQKLKTGLRGLVCGMRRRLIVVVPESATFVREHTLASADYKNRMCSGLLLLLLQAQGSPGRYQPGRLGQPHWIPRRGVKESRMGCW